MKKKSCRRKSAVERYQKKLDECFHTNFEGHRENKTDIKLKSNDSWGIYQEIKQDIRWLTGGSEQFHGHFGEYEPKNGHIKDFYPYDQTFEEY